MNLLKWIRISLGAVACLCSSIALADTVRISAFVERTMVDGDEKVGGCMAYLSENPAGVLPACKNSWVTFSCTGTYTDPIRAYRMLDQAQLALATGKRVDVTIHDSKTHNGYCFASRINLLSQ